MDWHAIEKMKVTDLRERAKEFGAKATTGMKKEELVEFVAEHLGVEKPAKAHHAHHGILTKAQLKETIAALRQEHEAARAKKDRKSATRLRRRIHGFKRQMREAS